MKAKSVVPSFSSLYFKKLEINSLWLHELKFLLELKRAASENLKTLCLSPDVGKYTSRLSALEPTNNQLQGCCSNFLHSHFFVVRGGATL